MAKTTNSRFTQHFTIGFIALFVAIGAYLIISLIQFYSAHKNYVHVNFDSVYNTRAMLKARLLADRFLVTLETAKENPDQDRLRAAEQYLSDQILQEKNFSYDTTGKNWLAPRLEALQKQLVQVRTIAASDPERILRLNQLILDTQVLVREMEAVERDSWGALSAVNAELHTRLDELSKQVGAIALLFVAMTLILMWILFKKAAAEAKLKTMLSTEEIVLERSPVGIVLTVNQGNELVITRANPKFADIAGYPLAHVIGKPIYSLLAASNDLQVPGQEELHRSLLAGKPLYLEGKRTNAHGQPLWFLATSRPIDISDPGQGIIWLFDDITERKLAEKSLRDNEANFRQMLENSPIAVRITSADGQHILYANQRYSELLNLDIAHLDRVEPRHYYANPQDYAETLEQLTKGENVVNKLVELNHPGVLSNTTWYLASYFKLEYGHEPAIIGWFYDVTKLKAANEELQLAYLVYQSSSEAMMVMDAEGTIITINPSFARITGYTLEDVIGANFTMLNSGEQGPAFYDAMLSTIRTTGSWKGEITNRRKNGELYTEALSINCTFNEDGSVHRQVALFADVTEKKKSEELIWQQANFDTVTRLPNRRMFHDRLDQSIRKAQRNTSTLALMFLDLDRFKEVNDTLGHETGDMLLQEAASRLLRCVRDSDTVARLGGDEFTVILSELRDRRDVESIAQKILRELAQPFHLGMETVYVSASIGITMYPDDGLTVDVLVKNADQAMYAAKHQGRNRSSYFTQALQDAAHNRLRMVSDLRAALEQSQFRVYYQPIVELATGVIYKAEALLRWEHPTRGLISPSEFIPIAEDTGMITAIGDWVIEQAAEQVASCRKIHDANFQISVNMSPIQFRDDTVANTKWVKHAAQTGLPGQSIIIEITEGLLMDATPTVTKKLLEFRDAGVQISLDDFGTGYSSLAYLKKFDIDYLKIDRSFVRNLATDPSDMALSEAIIVMAHKLGLKVIAEGVETAQQRDLLMEIGCDYAQGYFYAKPLPVNEFNTYLQTQKQSPALPVTAAL